MNSPTRFAIQEARAFALLTQAQCAALVYVEPRTWRKWELGERAMPEGLWELFCIKTGTAK